MIPLKRIKKLGVILATITFSLSVLQLALKYANIPSYIFPLPTEILKVFIVDKNLLIHAFFITFFEWSIGILIAVILGISIAILSARFKPVDRVSYPVLLISQSVPYLVFVPLLLLWFGLGYSSKIIIVVLTCMFPIALVLSHDLKQAQTEYKMIVKLLNLSSFKSFYHVYFPASLPGFFNALKVSVSYAFGSTVVAELMGSEGGLGIFLLQAQYTYRTDRIIAVAIIVVVMSLLSMFFVNKLAHKVVFWKKVKK